MKKVKTCFNCGSAKIEAYRSAADWHYGLGGTYDYSQCKECKLVFLDPMPDAAEFSSFYPEETYYAFHEDIYKELSVFKRLLLKLTFLDFKPKNPHFEYPGKILDIGCGSGAELYKYKKKGWEVAGVEPSTVAAETGNKAGLNIFNGDLLSASYPDESFDYIRSNHSFEHIDNPNETLQEMQRILKKDGKLFIGVPNLNGWNAKISGRYWYYFGAPVHPFNYSDKTLPQLLEKQGFAVEKIRYNSTWAGILGSIQIYLNRNKNLTSDKGFIFNFILFRMFAGLLAKMQNLLKAGDCIEVICTKKIRQTKQL